MEAPGFDVSSQGEVRRVPVVEVALQTQRQEGGGVDAQFDGQTRQRGQDQLVCHQRGPVVQLNLLTLEDKEERRQTGKTKGKTAREETGENILPPAYLEQFHSQSRHAQGQLVDLSVEIVTREHAELIAEHLHADPTGGPVLLFPPPPKQLQKTKHVVMNFTQCKTRNLYPAI